MIQVKLRDVKDVLHHHIEAKFGAQALTDFQNAGGKETILNISSDVLDALNKALDKATDDIGSAVATKLDIEQKTRNDGQVDRLDLHGTKHEDVCREMIRFIEDRWGTETEIEIITGNSPKMKKLVRSVLKEYNLECRAGELFHYNSGIIRSVVT